MRPESPVLLKETDVPEVVFGRDQPEYEPLPAIRGTGPRQAVTCRYKLGFAERIWVLFSGNIWIQQLTYGHPFHPILPLAKEPSRRDCVL